MIINSIIEIITNNWPMLLIFIVIVTSLRITYLIINHERFIFYKEILALLFVIYILSLFYTVTFEDVSWSTSNFVPFKEMFRYAFMSSSFIKNVTGNIIILMPYGLYVPYLLKTNKASIIMFLTLLISLTIEFTQLAIGRVFDIDDIMLNVLGGLLGYLMYEVVKKTEKRLPSFLRKHWLYNIIIGIIVLLGMIYLATILGVKL